MTLAKKTRNCSQNFAIDGEEEPRSRSRSTYDSADAATPCSLTDPSASVEALIPCYDLGVGR